MTPFGNVFCWVLFGCGLMSAAVFATPNADDDGFACAPLGAGGKNATNCLGK